MDHIYIATVHGSEKVRIDFDTVDWYEVKGGTGFIYTTVAPPHAVPMIEYEQFKAAYNDGNY